MQVLILSQNKQDIKIIVEINSSNYIISKFVS